MSDSASWRVILQVMYSICPTSIAYSHFCLWEFDARLIHMHGLVMTRSLRLAAVRLLWRAAAATCDDS